MAEVRERRVVVGGITTRALTAEGDGPPLVLLHGYADSADTWRLVLAGLARLGRAAWALDMPGFGRADRLDPRRRVLDQLDAFAAAAVEHAAAAAGAPVVLAGNSLGGCIALRAAEDEALPLAGIVPVAPAGLDHPAWFRAIEGDRLLSLLLSLPAPVPEAVIRAMVGAVYRRLAFARPDVATAEIVRAFTDHHASRNAVAGHLATGRRLLPELTDPFDLAAVCVPVLLVWGARDRMVSATGAGRVVDALPRTRVALLEDCGHCPQIEEHAALVELLVRFAQDRSRTDVP
jgi:pimeloyl-ACP methyl ester carboxylesterase